MRISHSSQLFVQHEKFTHSSFVQKSYFSTLLPSGKAIEVNYLVSLFVVLYLGSYHCSPSLFDKHLQEHTFQQTNALFSFTEFEI